MKKPMLWTVTSNSTKRGHAIYLECICKCGIKTFVRKSSIGVDSFGCKSCQCHSRTHGKSNTRLHNIWMAMKQRCYYEKSITYHNHGGRGIRVCELWRTNFNEFYKWAIKNGYSDNLSIDRINNDGDYEPSNCRWATASQQTRNQRTNIWHEANGKKMILKDWCRLLDLNYDTVRYRIYSGRSVKDALSLSTASGFKETKPSKFTKQKDKSLLPVSNAS